MQIARQDLSLRVADSTRKRQRLTQPRAACTPFQSPNSCVLKRARYHSAINVDDWPETGFGEVSQIGDDKKEEVVTGRRSTGRRSKRSRIYFGAAPSLALTDGPWLRSSRLPGTNVLEARLSLPTSRNLLQADFWSALLKVRPGSSFCASACAPPTALAARLKLFRDRSIRRLAT